MNDVFPKFRYSFSFLDAVQNSVLDEGVSPKKVRPKLSSMRLGDSQSHTAHPHRLEWALLEVNKGRLSTTDYP